MNELTPVQNMILIAIESTFRINGAYAANVALHIAGLCDGLPHRVMVKWAGIIEMAYDAEQARFYDRRANELRQILGETAYDAEMQEWHDTQASLEASVRL